MSLLAFSKSFDVEITETISKHLKTRLCGMYELSQRVFTTHRMHLRSSVMKNSSLVRMDL